MAHPLVVHFKREPYDVYVGRPGPWGNPFWDGTREENVRRHAKWLLSNPGLLAAIRLELRGKVLGCWCAPEDCHADTLAEIANAEPAEDDVMETMAEWEAEFHTSGIGWPE